MYILYYTINVCMATQMHVQFKYNSLIGYSYTGTDPEDLKGGWLDTVAKGTAAEVGNGCLWDLYIGVSA